jgi:uncharacterized membrane protein
MSHECAGTQRLEAFSDGVMAIIVTIIVFNLKQPSGPHWSQLLAVWPSLGTYGMSFAFVGIVSVHHHELVSRAHRVDTLMFWANMSLLFPMSLLPFATTYLADDLGSSVPIAFYAFVFLMTTAGTSVLAKCIARHPVEEEPGQRGAERAMMGKYFGSMVLYAAAIPMAFLSPWIAVGMIVFVGGLYLVPTSWPLSKSKQ